MDFDRLELIEPTTKFPRLQRYGTVSEGGWGYNRRRLEQAEATFFGVFWGFRKAPIEKNGLVLQKFRQKFDDFDKKNRKKSTTVD